jgi:hypothetical protein
MREPAFRGYAKTTRRELAGLCQKLHRAIDARASGHDEAAPPTEDRPDTLVPPDFEPPAEETRADWFARELGEGWVELEPGIFVKDEDAAVPT